MSQRTSRALPLPVQGELRLLDTGFLDPPFGLGEDSGPAILIQAFPVLFVPCSTLQTLKRFLLFLLVSITLVASILPHFCL